VSEGGIVARALAGMWERIGALESQRDILKLHGEEDRRERQMLCEVVGVKLGGPSLEVTLRRWFAILDGGAWRFTDPDQLRTVLLSYDRLTNSETEFATSRMAQNWIHVRDLVWTLDHRNDYPDDPDAVRMADDDVLQVVCDVLRRAIKKAAEDAIPPPRVDWKARAEYLASELRDVDATTRGHDITSSPLDGVFWVGIDNQIAMAKKETPDV
jgi:hypothetical protein